MRDHVLLYVNGVRHAVTGEAVFGSLSDFLRIQLGLTGTKVVCAEGDCGSCSVLVGRAEAGRINYQPICSCIQFVHQLDCAHIITIEGLKYEGKLNPVQEAMVKCQGAQCGFCTPGIIVSMYAMFDQKPQAQQREICESLVGNLCRCTGYQPIVRAGLETDRASIKPLNELYPSNTMAINLNAGEADEVLIRDARGRSMFVPRSMQSAVTFKRDHPTCTIISGGTDVGVQVNKGMREPTIIMTLGALPNFREIHHEDGHLILGGGASIAQMERACSTLIPEYSCLLYWFGSPPIKAAATIGGNIANGSPIGDSMPALFVLNGEIELTGVSGVRRVNINDFYTGYRKTVMREDEIISRVFVPIPRTDEIFKLYKISRRKDLDISAFTAAIWMRVANGAIQDIRLAYGGVGPNIIRLKQTESQLRGAAPTLKAFEQAGITARLEVKPISDVRGSMDYRLTLSQNIMAKLWHELNGTNRELLSVGTNGNGNGQDH